MQYNRIVNNFMAKVLNDEQANLRNKLYQIYEMFKEIENEIREKDSEETLLKGSVLEATFDDGYENQQPNLVEYYPSAAFQFNEKSLEFLLIGNEIVETHIINDDRTVVQSFYLINDVLVNHNREAIILDNEVARAFASVFM